MSQAYQPSPEALEQLRETFQFLKHDREDIRKMAVHGIAENSKDSRDLWAYMSDANTGGKSIDLLLSYLHAGSASILGDILTILINVSAEGSCAELLVQHKVVRKAMRLLDGMEKSVLPDSFVTSIEELTFMLLSNVTASHVSAVDDLLQKEDEDMRGFYLGKLQKYYDHLATKASDRERTEENERGAASGGATMGGDGENGQPQLQQASGRDLRKWILQILLNLTRTYDGQELLLEDEDWRVTLNECLSSENAFHRLLAAQCCRNCACSQRPQYALLLKSPVLTTAVQRLATRNERHAQVQLCLAEFIASMLESEQGMEKLESINAKKLLAESVTVSRAMLAMAAEGKEDSPSRVEVLDDNGNPVLPSPTKGAEGPPPLAPDVCVMLEKHVLPYLDDIVDAFLAPGSDEVD